MIHFHIITLLKKLEKVVVFSTKIGALVHETQKERGMTAGFLGSKGKKFKDKLPKQRELTNNRIKELSSFFYKVLIQTRMEQTFQIT